MGTFSDLKNYVLRVKFWNFEFSSGPFSYWQNVSFFDFVFIKILEWGVFSPPKCSCQSDGHIFGPEKVSFGCQILKISKKSIFWPQTIFWIFLTSLPLLTLLFDVGKISNPWFGPNKAVQAMPQPCHTSPRWSETIQSGYFGFNMNVCIIVLVQWYGLN